MANSGSAYIPEEAR